MRLLRVLVAIARFEATGAEAAFRLVFRRFGVPPGGDLITYGPFPHRITENELVVRRVRPRGTSIPWSCISSSSWIGAAEPLALTGSEPVTAVRIADSSRRRRPDQRLPRA